MKAKALMLSINSVLCIVFQFPKTTTMGMFALLPFLFVVVYLVIFFVILFLVYYWVSKFIALRQEQNDLLREIIKRMDKN